MFRDIEARSVVAALVLMLSSIASGAESQSQEIGPPSPAPRQGQAAGAEVRELLERAAQCAVAVEDPEDRVFRLCHLARVQFRHGLRDAAVQTLRQAREAVSGVQDPDYRAHRLGDIAECHAEFGDAQKALELVNGLPEMHRDSALRYVSKAQVERGTLDRAAETAAMIRQPVYLGETLQRIATAYAERADFVTAKRLAGEIPETSGQTHAWAAIAIRQLQTGDRSAAEEALQQAIKTAGQIPYDPAEPSDQKPVALAAIARAQAEFGDVERARRTVQRIAQAPWQDLALGEIASVQSQRGEFQAAVRSTDAIKVSYYRGQAVTAIVAALAEKGDFDGSRKLAESITYDVWRLDAFLKVAESQLRAGQHEAGARLLQTVLREAGKVTEDKTLPVRGLQRGLLYRLAKVQGQAGQVQEASEWISQEPSADIRMMAYLGLLEGLPASQTHKPKATRVSIQGPFKKYGTLSLKDLALPDECRSFIELDRMKLSDRPSVDSVFVVFTFKGEEDRSRVLDVQCIAVNEQGQPIAGHREVYHDPRIEARKPTMGGKFRRAPFANISIQLPKGVLFSDVRSIDLVVTQVCDEGQESGS